MADNIRDHRNGSPYPSFQNPTPYVKPAGPTTYVPSTSSAPVAPLPTPATGGRTVKKLVHSDSSGRSWYADVPIEQVRPGDTIQGPDGNPIVYGQDKGQGYVAQDGTVVRHHLPYDGAPPPGTGSPGGSGGPNGAYGINPALYALPGYDDIKNGIATDRARILNQQAVVPKAAVVGPMAHGQAAPFGDTSYITNPAAITAQQAGPVTLGPLQQAAAGQVGPMAQAQNSAFRQNQADAIDYQTKLMKGDYSVAALQEKRMADQALSQQMAMAASARPGQEAMMARLSAQNQGNIMTDLVGRTLEAQQAERNSGATYLGQFAGQARGQDQDISMFNAGEKNKGSIAQAGYTTTANVANAGNATTQNVAQGRINADIGINNSQQGNDIAKTNVANKIRVDTSNQDAANHGRDLQYTTQTDVNLKNAGYDNQGILNQADINERSNEAGAREANNFTDNQNKALGFLSQLGLNAAEAMQKGGIAAADDIVKQIVTTIQADTTLKAASMTQPDFWTRLFGALPGGLALIETVKRILSGDDKKPTAVTPPAAPTAAPSAGVFRPAPRMS